MVDGPARSVGARPGAGSDFWLIGDREAQARELWCNTTKSAREIAQLLGCSKNAVLGKAYREDWGRRVEPRPKPEKRDPFRHLTGTSCRWPMGHPRDPDFRFCGDPALPNRPYCSRHTTIAVMHRRFEQIEHDD